MSAQEVKELSLALLCGGVVGFLFGKLRLPIPAPPSLAGLLGIVGIAAGYWLSRLR